MNLGYRLTPGIYPSDVSLVFHSLGHRWSSDVYFSWHFISFWILLSSRVSVFLSPLLSSHMLTPEVIEVSLDSIDEFILFCN